MYDVIIIGGGTSGLMAASSASMLNKKVLLLEKNDILGKKLLLTGGGRCNVTNNKDINHIVDNIHTNGKFLYSAFSCFNNKDIIKFFNDRGVSLKEEDNGRMFPVTNSSRTILNTFINELDKNNVNIMFNSKVDEILVRDNKVIGVIANGKNIYSKSIILATGGKTHPHTGSTGDGYKLCKNIGHTITKLYPSEVPLICDDDFKTDLKGLSLKNIKLSVLNGNKVVVSHNLDMIFTHFGVSGPAVLRCSSYANKLIEKNSFCRLRLDCIPYIKENELFLDSKLSIKLELKKYIPERYIKFLCDKENIDFNTLVCELSKSNKEKLISLLKCFEFEVNGTLEIEKAFITSGGISLKEINPKTMESKIVEGLYFCGEVMDIAGYTGGYNITVAFVTGYVAGLNC